MIYSVVPMSEADFELRLEEAVSLYITAMKYNPAIFSGRLTEWAKQPLLPGFTAVGAIAHPEGVSPSEALDDPRYPLIGIGYCRTGRDTYWWHRQVRAGMASSGWPLRTISTLLGNYAELSEIHIHPDYQGKGVGKRLLRELISGREEAVVLLSTPEFPNEANRAWRLYRQFGFVDVLRNFHFNGDSRPFAVLGVKVPHDSVTGAADGNSAE
ncbi:acetyltransferase [Corynebacterium lactis RW2-5]|uniref:Acetyltransferase n=2 Tax=Corynebacterium lactis TaxID=1231000 RepID=A0A0K2H1Q9_9CORY|nr:acetyltransferase [Corynebacterium lactis RW2-5]